MARPNKCTPRRGLAHHWLLKGQYAPYVWARCKHCKNRRLFKTAWPDRIDWPAERETRLRRERNARRRRTR